MKKKIATGTVGILGILFIPQNIGRQYLCSVDNCTILPKI